MKTNDKIKQYEQNGFYIIDENEEQVIMRHRSGRRVIVKKVEENNE